VAIGKRKGRVGGGKVLEGTECRLGVLVGGEGDDGEFVLGSSRMRGDPEVGPKRRSSNRRLGNSDKSRVSVDGWDYEPLNLLVSCCDPRGKGTIDLSMPKHVLLTEATIVALARTKGVSM
jgi:hypothetical protein